MILSGIPELKAEQKVLATFSPEQVKALLAVKPKGRNAARAQIILTVSWISEALAFGDSI